MAIRVQLDRILAQRRMSLTELADRVGVTVANPSILNTGKARAVRHTTLDALCRELDCLPGDPLAPEPRPPAASTDAAPDAAPDADDKRLWARVASTVTPPVRRKAARVTPGAVVPPEAELEAAAPPVARGAAGKKRNAALTPASAGRSTTPA